MIHPSAEVYSEVIGMNTSIWQFAVVMEGAKIGDDCNIGSHVFIENNVSIGDRVTIKNGAMLFEGLTIADQCFIGPGVVFTNDLYPRSERVETKRSVISEISIEKGVSIGANATIRAGILIGEYSLIGAGAMVTKDVPPFSLVLGNPGKIVGTVDKNGEVVSRLAKE